MIEEEGGLLCPLKEFRGVKEKPFLNLSFTEWLKPLWQAKRASLSQASSLGFEFSKEERKIKISQLAHLWFPAALIFARNPEVCLDFKGRSLAELIRWLENEHYFPTQQTKRKTIAEILLGTVTTGFEMPPVGQKVGEFMADEGGRKLWQAVCANQGYFLNTREIRQPLLGENMTQSPIFGELNDLQPQLTKLINFCLCSNFLVPEALFLFERALAVQLQEDNLKVQIFYQPDVIFALPSSEGWQVGIWDLKLGVWQDKPPWRYTLAFYHKVASALKRYLDNDKKAKERLVGGSQLDLNLKNQPAPSAYGLLWFLEGQPVASQPLARVANLQVPALDNEEFWRLNQHLFRAQR
jgi:hypothetical protein